MGWVADKWNEGGESVNTTTRIVQVQIAEDVSKRWLLMWKKKIPTAQEIEDCARQLAWDWYVKGRGI